MRLFLVGDANDCQLAKEFEKKIIWPTPILNFTGKLSLYETAIALRQAQCLLSNDSALGHLAEAVDTPVGILFGPTTEKFGFSPYKEKSKSFSAQLSCRPCSKHGKKSCRYNDKLCFTSIPKSDIVAFLLNFFNRSKRYFVTSVWFLKGISFLSLSFFVSKLSILAVQ